MDGEPACVPVMSYTINEVLIQIEFAYHMEWHELGWVEIWDVIQVFVGVQRKFEILL
jgi:hypothetical protein